MNYSAQRQLKALSVATSLLILISIHGAGCAQQATDGVGAQAPASGKATPSGIGGTQAPPQHSGEATPTATESAQAPPPKIPEPEPIPETAWLQNPDSRLGFSTESPPDKTGVDASGWFHQPENQEPAPSVVLSLAADHARAEGVLNRGQIVELKSLEDDYVMFRAKMKLAPEDAARLGEEHLYVAFKPASRAWYGSEYRHELVYYRLAQHMGVQGVLPMVERDVAFEPLRAELKKKLTDELRQTLTTHRDDEDIKQLHGTVQLWMVGLNMRIGSQRSERYIIGNLAKQIHLGEDSVADSDPIWQTLSDMFVLDYLVYNHDRGLEVGTAGLPDGGQRLVLLDHGDAVRMRSHQDAPHQPYNQWFNSIQAFSPNIHEGLKTLTPELLATIWVDSEGETLCEPMHLQIVSDRAQTAVARIDQLAQEAGGPEAVLFSRPSPPMN
jgi:hypothetical protein